MEHILVVACNQKKLTEGLKFAKDNGFPEPTGVYPGAKSFTRKFSAVLIYHKKSNEVNLMKDLVRNYEHVPIKVCVGEEPFTGAEGINAVPFVYGDAAKVLAHLTAEYAKLDEIMSKVFV
jgi:hypothetical protein